MLQFEGQQLMLQSQVLFGFQGRRQVEKSGELGAWIERLEHFVGVCFDRGGLLILRRS